MKFSAKRSPPSIFVSWLALANANWSPTYKNLSGAERRAIMDALLQEQGYVCAYCGRGLNSTGSNGHIDHFWPQSHFGPGTGNDKSLDYDNFFLSCGPNTLPLGDPKRLPTTCGEAKENGFNVTNFVIPSDPTCEGQFAYGNLGTISAKPSNNVQAQVMLDALNLSDSSLSYERSVLLNSIETDIQAGVIDQSNKQQFIIQWRQLDSDGRSKSLGHVAARYLEDEL